MKMFYTGIASLAVAATVGVISVVMEIITQEPVYITLMKVSAIIFGFGGGILGLRAWIKKEE